MKRILFIVALASIFSFAACSKWTTVEPIDVHYTTLEEKNPSLYNAYYQSLREYRATLHGIMIAKFDNKSTSTVGMADHLTALPDSVDYVILTNPTEATEKTLSEIAEIREKKGIKTLIEADYAAFESAYKEMITAEEELATADSTYTAPGDSLGRFTAWLEEQMGSVLNILSSGTYDGINLIYNGKNPLSMQEDARADLKARQEAFFANTMKYLAANEGLILFFEGMSKNLLVDENVLGTAKYIIVPAESATTSYEFTQTVAGSYATGNPTDKFVIGVTTQSLTDPSNLDGTFSGTDDNGNSLTAIVGAGYWVSGTSTNFGKAGVCVSAAQNDYYNITKVYSNIRESIAIMNPSPLK